MSQLRIAPARRQSFRLLVSAAAVGLAAATSPGASLTNQNLTGPADMANASTWSPAQVPTAADSVYMYNTPDGTDTTYTLSQDVSMGAYYQYYRDYTFDLGAGRTLTVGSSGNAGAEHMINGWGQNTQTLGRLTLKSGTMTFTHGYRLKVGTEEARNESTNRGDLIIDGGTFNWNALAGGGSPGVLSVKHGGLLWVKNTPGSVLNAGSTIGVGYDEYPTSAQLAKVGEGGKVRIDGTLNATGGILLGAYGYVRPGVLEVAGQLNLNRTAGNVTALGAQMHNGHGGIIDLKGGTISAAAPQRIGQEYDKQGTGAIRGSGTFNNLDIWLGTHQDVTNANHYGRLTPGSAADPTGAITMTNGSLVLFGGAVTQLDLMSDGSADQVLLPTPGKDAQIVDAIDYSAVGSLAGLSGVFDFVKADEVYYRLSGSWAVQHPGTDINVDDLPSIVEAAGYTRVAAGTTPAVGQYRYYLADAGGGMEAIRLELVGAPIPEPASLGLLALGGLAALRRRR